MSVVHCQSSEYHGPHEWVGQSGLRRDCPGVKDLMRALRESVAVARAVSGEQHSGSASVVTPSVEAQPGGQPR